MLPTVLSYFALWTTLWLTTYYTVPYLSPVRYRSHKARLISSGQLIGFVHATVSVYWSSLELYRLIKLAPDFNYLLDSTTASQILVYNTPKQNQILLWTITYFAFDTIKVLYARETIFLLHHLDALVYTLSSYYLNLGAYWGILGLFWGEVTNPVHNIWQHARQFGYYRVYHFFTPIFTYYFILVRAIIMPPFAILAVIQIIQSTPPIPTTISYFWVLNTVTLLLGSWYWIYGLWQGYHKYISKTSTQTTNISAPSLTQ